MDKIKAYCKNLDILKLITFIFPIVSWLPKYNLGKFHGDLIAGITVGIMIIPQSIAFGTLAGLPPQYGLYAALTPGITYCLFGGSKDVSMGPTVTMALFTYRFNAHQVPIGASMLAFFVGLVLIAMAILRLGFVTKFIPSHVISGFVSAAAVVIASTQLKSLFGHAESASDFFGKIGIFFKNLKHTNPWDISLGVFCLVFLLFFMVLSKTKLNKPIDGKSSVAKKMCFKLLWFLCIAKSALICIIGTIVAFVFYKCGYNDSFTLAGELPSGIPNIQVPLQSVALPSNDTITTKDFLNGFGASLAVLPIIQFIQTISIAKAFGKKNKYDVDAAQELLALGLANFVGSFFRGWPVTGSFSRSAVQAMSGTQTPLTGIISSTIIFLALSFLTPVFYYIPKPALSAMIIMAVVTMIDVKMVKKIYNVRKIDVLPYLVTFFGTFYKLEAGVLAGAVIALVIMVSREVNPVLDISIINNTSITIIFKNNLAYPGIDSVKFQINQIIKEHPSLKVLIIDMANIEHIDYDVFNGLVFVLFDIKAAGVALRFVNFPNDHTENCFIKAGLINSSGEIETIQEMSSLLNIEGVGSCNSRKNSDSMNVDIPNEDSKEKDSLICEDSTNSQIRHTMV